MLLELGISFDDLPPKTPVEVRLDENGNPVTITAEQAAALLLLGNPIELLQNIFSDPAKALMALASIGADMSDEEREESEKVIIAAVIVAQIAMLAGGATGSGGGVPTGKSGPQKTNIRRKGK